MTLAKSIYQLSESLPFHCCHPPFCCSSICIVVTTEIIYPFFYTLHVILCIIQCRYSRGDRVSTSVFGMWSCGACAAHMWLHLHSTGLSRSVCVVCILLLFWSTDVTRLNYSIPFDGVTSALVLLEFSKIVSVFNIQALAAFCQRTTTHCIHFRVLTLFMNCGLTLNAFVVFIVSEPTGCSSLFEASETVWLQQSAEGNVNFMCEIYFIVQIIKRNFWMVMSLNNL